MIIEYFVYISVLLAEHGGLPLYGLYSQKVRQKWGIFLNRQK